MISIKQIIPFMRYRKIAATLSAILVVLCIVSLATRWLVLGLDFTGGILVEVSYSEAADLKSVRATLEAGGLDDAVVQHFGKATDVLVRIPPQDTVEQSQIGDKIVAELRNASAAELTLKRIEFVGPQIGDELRDQSGIAMIFALGCMLLYVTLRFKFKFAVGAVAALFHDVIITVGIFSLFGIQFDLTVLAAVLAVIGYSLNDTIVVSDRIRENFRLLREESSEQVINESLSQTLSRTLMTSITTLLVLTALLLFGGELIRGFSIALIVGVIVGTYSSIYVASNVLMAMSISREDFLEPVLEEVDEMP